MDIKRTLREYSESKLSTTDAMFALSICCMEDLYAATFSAGFALPRQSTEEVESEAEGALRFLEQR